MLGDGLNSLIPNKNHQVNENLNEENINQAGEPVFNFPNINPEPPKSFQNQIPSFPKKIPTPIAPNTEVYPEEEEEEYQEEQIPEPAPQVPVYPVNDMPIDNQNPSYQVNFVKADFTPKKEQPTISKNFSKGEPSDHIFLLEVEKIKPNPYQPRRYFDAEALKELSASIAEFGIIQPLIVSKKIIETSYGTDVEYELIAGERRLRAAKLAGLERVPSIIKQAQPKKEKLELAIIENIQREDLNPIEAARSFAQLQDDYGMTQREIATRMGKSREVVANTMRLLSLPTYIQEAISQGKISESQGRLLLTVPDLNTQQNLFQELITKGLTVKELRNKVANTNARENAIKRFKNDDPELRHLAEKLSELLGTKVKVEKNGDTGRITISFNSADELKGIIDRVIPEGDI
ncbi:MAG: hypothetical protein COV57_03475 [Candidatus Liptonbacteria bacterium CG11_big_fil_rev_8_21_14_0_20_35_14]|uniref:ParB-like N-terminal domain-containing protein n=1 Tax=Candidatus Liptonbacteria bacterium CG11_big_fil_rev_8_21_14_0_20_35_14 TaxID=1974634 RepID=A0A2H0N930_9BACT|nr:MAG: hypothetical protein COV57_03475 [Candidatus Liptonbacteria bacterium CG11_big_fil_rev_8_21_14_0_20_35_14]